MKSLCSETSLKQKNNYQLWNSNSTCTNTSVSNTVQYLLLLWKWFFSCGTHTGDAFVTQCRLMEFIGLNLLPQLHNLCIEMAFWRECRHTYICRFHIPQWLNGMHVCVLLQARVFNIPLSVHRSKLWPTFCNLIYDTLLIAIFFVSFVFSLSFFVLLPLAIRQWFALCVMLSPFLSSSFINIHCRYILCKK